MLFLHSHFRVHLRTHTGTLRTHNTHAQRTVSLPRPIFVASHFASTCTHKATLERKTFSFGGSKTCYNPYTLRRDGLCLPMELKRMTRAKYTYLRDKHTWHLTLAPSRDNILCLSLLFLFSSLLSSPLWDVPFFAMWGVFCCVYVAFVFRGVHINRKAGGYFDTT